MATVCAFCGEKLSLFNKEALVCGGLRPPVCKSCFNAHLNTSQEERARLILEAGYIELTDELRAFLETRQAQLEEKHRNLLTDKICSHCGQQMLFYARQQFKLGQETILFSDINRLIAGSMDLEVLYCKSCRKVDFFLPEDSPSPLD